MKKLIGFGVSIVGLSALLVLAGCGSKDEVVAKVGGQKISLKMVSERLQDAPPAYHDYLGTEAGRKQFLDLMVRERLVIESARKAGTQNKEEFKKALGEFKRDQLRRIRDYEDNLLMELYIRDLHDKVITVADKEVEQYYQEHRSEYARPVEVVARHILVATPEEAEKARARVKAGADFARVAKEVSTDPISAERGGEIGPFRKGDLVPEFEQAVFPLKTGEVSPVVKTQFGYHIIKKVHEKTLPARSMDESKFDIKKMLQKIKFDAWLEKTKEKYNVNVNYGVLSRIPASASPENAGMPDGAAGEKGTTVPQAKQ
ncbi:MAG: peptidylprolyl isomerase [Endomicrobiales bacterium]